MKRIERHQLIDTIARHLQATMTTSDINVFVGGFGIQHPDVTMVSSKWTYVKQLLSDVDDAIIIPMALELGLEVPTTVTIGSQELKNLLDINTLHICQEDFNRALRDIDTNPAQAIGNASTTLESICKAILDALQQPYPKDESLQPLLKAVFDVMNLSPDGHADPDIKRILGGLTNAASGLAVLRTKYSTFHGKGAKQLRLGKRHARLAVHALSTVGLFLLETYQERLSRTNDTAQNND